MSGGDGKEPERRRWIGRVIGRRHGDAQSSPEGRARVAHPAGGAPSVRRRRDAGDLVDEAQAFLDGRYAEQLSDRSMWVPPWAWTNLLAHGGEDAVHRAARGSGQGPVATRGWWAARGYLATELLRTVGRGASLRAVQHDVLVPLELDLAHRRDVAGWTPQQWVSVVRAALQANWHSHQV